jgi:sulfatase modifying factor 1
MAKNDLRIIVQTACPNGDAYDKCRWLEKYLIKTFGFSSLEAFPKDFDKLSGDDLNFISETFHEMQDKFAYFAGCSRIVNNKSNKVNDLDKMIEGLNLILVGGGTFLMGSNDSEAYGDEKPVHDVTLSDYYIGTYEVTNNLWRKMMDNHSMTNIAEGNLPVENVNWFECVEFCNKLSAHYGLRECYNIQGKNVFLLNGGKGGFRLPTEAEWEYAARGGQYSRGFKYAGSNYLDEVAWHDTNSGGRTHDVGGKKPNELGLYDMSGNVWEWCWDRWPSNYDFRSVTNPIGPSSGSSRVFRGGSWFNYSRCCRVSCRHVYEPGEANGYLGFRFVLAL